MRRLISSLLLINTLAISTAVQATQVEELLTPGRIAKRVFNNVFTPESHRVFDHFHFSNAELGVLGLDPAIIYCTVKTPMTVEELDESEESLEAEPVVNETLQAIQHIDQVICAVAGRGSKNKNTHLALLHVFGVNFVADKGFDEEIERRINGKPFYYSNACPAFERRCRAASQQFMILADELNRLNHQQGSLKMLSLSLAMLRIPVAEELADQFYKCQFIQTGLVARDVFSRMENLMRLNRTLIPGNVDWQFCCPFSKKKDPRLTTTVWQVIALKLADTSKEQKELNKQRSPIGNHYSYEHVRDMVPLYIRAARLAEAEAGYSDGESKALYLKMAHSFWLGLYWAVKQWDAAGQSADDREGEPYWPEVRRLGLAAADAFLTAGKELLTQPKPKTNLMDVCFNNTYAADVYFEAFHVRITLPRTPQEDLPNALECLRFVQAGIEDFEGAGVDLQKCNNFFETQKTGSAATVFDAANRRVYQALWDLFKEQMQTYAGPKVKTKAEIIDPYFTTHSSVLELIKHEYQTPLMRRCSEVLDKYQDKWFAGDEAKEK